MFAELISKINDFFLADCIKFNLSNGNQIGFSFLNENNTLTSINMPKIEEVSNQYIQNILISNKKRK